MQKKLLALLLGVGALLFLEIGPVTDRDGAIYLDDVYFTP